MHDLTSIVALVSFALFAISFVSATLPAEDNVARGGGSSGLGAVGALKKRQGGLCNCDPSGNDEYCEYRCTFEAAL